MNLLGPLEWAVVLLVLGCGLLVLEVFIPSGGVIGFFAAVAIVSSIVVAFRRDLTTGLAFTAVTLFAVPAAVGLAFKYWPHTPMGKAFLGDLPTDQDTAPDDPRRKLIGRIGVAKSKMLPSGAVLVDGKVIDAICRGGAVEPGQSIKVVEVRGNRVVVRPARAGEAAAKVSSDDLLGKPIEDFGLESIDEPLA